MKSTITIPPANVTVTARNRSGKVVSTQRVRNAVTAVGRNVLRDLLIGRGPAPRYIASGTGTTATADSDTALESEVYRRQVDRVIPGGNKVSYEMFVTPVEGNATETENTYGDFCEIGLFAGTAYQEGSVVGGTTRHPSIGGMLVARAIIQPVAKTSDITLTITWEMNISAM